MMMFLLVAVLLKVIPRSDMLICKLRAPPGASNGLWPGNVIILNCTILKDGPVEYITWQKDGKILRNTSLVSPEWSGSPLLMWQGLKIDNLSVEDDGRYSCVAVKGVQSREDWYTLHIFAKPRILIPRQAEVERREGDRYSMTCSAIGWPKPKITWMKDGNEYKESSSIRKSSLGLTLDFILIRLADSGLYECYANNSIGSDVRPVFVEVTKVVDHIRTVKVTTQYHQITVYESQNSTLECQAADVLRKMTVCFWKHNGKLLEGAETQHRFEGPEQVTFWHTIIDVSLKDAGSYTCGVQTHEGSDSQLIRLKVEKKGPPRVSSKSPNLFPKLGRSATLSCTLKYADNAKAVKQWKRNNSQIFSPYSEHYNIEHRDISEGSLIFSLVITNVTLEDLGCYNCYVNTSLGSNSSSVCLQLKEQRSSKELLTILSYATSPVDPLWKTTVPVFLVCLVVCLVGFITGFYARRNRLRRSGFQVNSDPRTNVEYQYDVFITFSSKDFHWVQRELIPLIEKHNLNYCIHNRDFQPGRTIVDNMADSVYNSRHILAVLSKNYMSSTFCRGELDMALCRNTLLKDSSLIAIRVDEIEKKKLPKALQGKAFLDYYKDQENNLWEIRLAKQLALKEEEVVVENSL